MPKLPAILCGTCVLTSLCVTSLPDAFAAEDKTHLLRYQFHRGEIVGYEVNDQSKLVLQQQEAEQSVDHGAVTNKRYTVTTVDGDGNAVLELQIDRVQMRASVDGGDSIAYDTQSGEEPPAAFAGISTTVGKPYTRVKVSPRGELLSLDWLIAAEQKSKPTKADAAELDIVVVLPEEPVKVGDTWKEPFEVEIGATPTLKKKIRLQREYTLKQVEGSLATISLKTVVLSPLHDPAEESQLVRKTPKGTVVFDLARGVVTSRTYEVDKVIVGFSGPDSKVHTINTRKEQLAPVQVAAKPLDGPVRK